MAIYRYNEIMSRKLDISKLIDSDEPVEEADKLMRKFADDLEKIKSQMKDTDKEIKDIEYSLNEIKLDIANMNEKAIKAIQDGNYDGAKIFFNNKSNLEKSLDSIRAKYMIFKDDMSKLNDMYDLLSNQISTLSSQKIDIKIKAAIKKAQHFSN